MEGDPIPSLLPPVHVPATDATEAEAAERGEDAQFDEAADYDQNEVPATNTMQGLFKFD